MQLENLTIQELKALKLFLESQISWLQDQINKLNQASIDFFTVTIVTGQIKAYKDMISQNTGVLENVKNRIIDLI